MPVPLSIIVGGTNRAIDVHEGTRLTAGRAADCDLRLDDQSVSRRHVALERRGDEIAVTDLDSANGTYVNERQVRRATVRAGDLIRVGTTVLEVHEGRAHPLQHPEPKPSKRSCRACGITTRSGTEAATPRA